MSRWMRGAAACTATLGLLTGCSDAVEVDSPQVDAAAKHACEQLLDRVPHEFDGLQSRDTEPEDALAAAWGDPAVVLRCGVEMPEGFTRFSSCNEINGVGWYASDADLEDQTREITLTTIGWTPAVELRVPAEYRPPSDLLVELAAPIKATLTQRHRCV